MKKICTQVLTVLVLIIAQNSFAQNSVSVGTSFPSPAPSPGFGSVDSVKATNGFATTTTGAFNNFPKGKTTTLTSPFYYYPSVQTTVYFMYNISVATSGSATVTPQVSIITTNGDTLSATATVSTTLAATGGVNYYFTFNLVSPLASNTSFKIALTMDVANSDKSVVAQTFSTNAIRGTAPAPLPMPVKFTGVTAQKISGGISLIWNVATEINVNSYEVQKSIDGRSFSTIGAVAASGKSSYNFVDSKSFDKVYYRIQSTDIDGKHGYSTIVTVQDQQSSATMKAWPTLVQNEVTVQHTAATANSKIEIASIDGKLIKSIAVANGTQQTNIDLSAAKAGVYIVRFVNNASVQSLKIVKQ